MTQMGVLRRQFNLEGHLTEPLFCTYILVYLSYVPGPVLRYDHGDLSYGLYLYAFPVQLLLIKAFPWLTSLALFPLAMLTTLALAILSSLAHIEHRASNSNAPAKQRCRYLCLTPNRNTHKQSVVDQTYESTRLSALEHQRPMRSPLPNPPRSAA